MSRALALVTAAAVAVPAAWSLANASREVYAIPGWGVALTLALLAAGLAGSALIARARRPGLSAAVLAGVALLAFGLLAILSVGLIALLAGVALLSAALRRDAGVPRRGSAIAGAALVGAVLPLLLVIALSGPVVDCGPGGTSAGENLFMAVGSDETQGSGTDSPDGRSSGHARGDNYEYRFACEDGRLVEFEFRWR